MFTFPTDRICFTLGLYEEDRLVGVLDVFPHRIHPYDGASTDDVIWDLLMAMSEQDDPYWRPENAASWLSPRGPETVRLRSGLIEPGAFSHNPSCERTDETTILPVYLHHDRMVLDGHAVTLAYPHNHPQSDEDVAWRAKRILDASEHSVASTVVALGVVDALLSSDVHDLHTPLVVALIAARCAMESPHALINPPKNVVFAATRLADDFLHGWLVRPASQPLPTGWAANPTLVAMLDQHRHDPHFSFGASLAPLAVPLAGDKDPYLQANLPTASAHHTVRFQADKQALHQTASTGAASLPSTLGAVGEPS